MRMKRFLGSALNLYMMVPFHLKNTIFGLTKKNSFAGWKTLRVANLANETAVRERLDTSDVNGGGWRIYSVSGGGVVPDYTVVVPVDDREFD
jgi:hypothetical protein